MLDTFKIVVSAFSVVDKRNRVKFFKDTFLVANITPKVVFGMLFLILSGADVDFLGWKLWWRTYTTEKALLTTRRIEIVGKKKFANAALDQEYEVYIVYIRSVSFNVLLSSCPLDVHPFRRSQISGLIAKEAPTKVPAEYLDFTDIFSPDLAFKLLKHTRINDHAIKLVNGQQPPYKLICSLGLVELKTLKT